MLISIAVVTGFKNEIRRKIAGFNSQVTIYSQTSTTDRIEPVDITTQLKHSIEKAAPDSKMATSIEVQGILKTDSAFQGLVIKGVDNGAPRAFIESQISKGRMPETGKENRIAISAMTATSLGLDTCDKVFAHFFTDGDFKTRRFTVSAIYDTHFGDYDKRYAFTDIETARKVAKLDSTQCTLVELTGIDEDKIQEVSSELSQILLSDALLSSSSKVPAVDNVLRSGAAYFSWLDLLDTNVVVILVLMSLVAGFTLISSLFILILERVRTIGILKSLGTTNRQIRGIFIYMAEKLVIRGLIIGNVIGLGLIFLQSNTHILPLDADAYYLSFVPAEISWQAVALLNICIVVISALVLILPSHMISTLSPAESMRYE